MSDPITVIPNDEDDDDLAWIAYRGDYNCAKRYVFARTEAEARAELLRMEDEDYCCTVCPYERREWEDCALNGGCPLVKQP